MKNLFRAAATSITGIAVGGLAGFAAGVAANAAQFPDSKALWLMGGALGFFGGATAGAYVALSKEDHPILQYVIPASFGGGMFLNVLMNYTWGIGSFAAGAGAGAVAVEALDRLRGRNSVSLAPAP